MRKKNIMTRVVIPIIATILSIGVWIWYIYYKATIFDLVMLIFIIVVFAPFLINALGYTVLGNLALEYRPSLIPKFFKDKKTRGNSDITKYYYLGKYYFNRADYEKAERYFDKSVEADFYKNTVLKLEKKKEVESFSEVTKDYGIDKKIEEYYKKHNDFIAFIKSAWLFIKKTYNNMISFIDGFYLQQKPILFYIKTKKIVSPNYEFLHDFDEDKMQFKGNDKSLFEEDEKLTEEQKAAKSFEKLQSGFDGSVDLQCIKALLILKYSQYAYYEKSLEISHKLIDIVEKSTNQTIMWRLLYVRGFVYHKLGEADLACKDWKRGFELGDTKYCKDMYDENCKN